MKSLNFNGTGLEYFKIWIVNILLVIVTLGLYYPWAKVRNNRYFYANSTLEDRNFDYHATGKQLFLGYLIAMALFLLYVVIQQVSPAGSGIVFLLFMIALPWIVWRSLKFNMRITSFSNVRFSFEGQLGGAYFNFLLLPFIFIVLLYSIPILLTFGLAKAAGSIAIQTILVVVSLLLAGLAVYMLGVLKKKNTSYFLNSTRYGQGQFSTELEATKFMKISFKTIGLFLVAVLACLIIVSAFTMTSGTSSPLAGLTGKFGDPEVMQEIFGNPSVLFAIGSIYIGLLLISVLVFSYSFARQRSYIYANSKLDNKISFASTLKARSMAWVSFTNLLAVIFSLGLAIPWAKVRVARLLLENTLVDTSVGFEEYVTQQQAEQSSLGEQIGDAFDVDMGISI